jgi:hypothetical protein
VLLEADQAKDRADRAAAADGVARVVEEHEDEVDEERDEERDDLAAGHGRNEQADGDGRGAHEREPEVTREDGAHVDRAEVPRELEHHDRVDRGRGDQRHHEAHRAEVLAHDDLPVVDREGDEHLERAGGLLFGDQAHRDDGHHEHAEAVGRVLEEAVERSTVDLPEAALEEEKEDAEDQLRGADDDVGKRAVEVREELALRDGQSCGRHF